jgi:hypothetical protein
VERLSILWLCCVLALPPGCLLLADPPPLTDDTDDVAYTGPPGPTVDTEPSSGWTHVAVSFSRVCALDGEGQLWCGSGVGDLSWVDAGPFVSLSSNSSGNACVVHADGQLRC